MALHDLVQNLFWDHAGRTAFRRVASKGVYAGGGSIAEGGAGCKPKGGHCNECLPLAQEPTLSLRKP
ncbi:hypothetical protein BQ8482_180461 [Mesorhizobium delmotii]|uniref:Uncharacterized protein n=1 Tax=Mesorhizobium delmotii TaxID=1631247 RepID=A0A2P9AJG9_9HYPH|nr:hypothetical protein BQ8482_180461 [Mesorhizobium delmotii]